MSSLPPDQEWELRGVLGSGASGQPGSPGGCYQTQACGDQGPASMGATVGSLMTGTQGWAHAGVTAVGRCVWRHPGASVWAAGPPPMPSPPGSRLARPQQGSRIFNPHARVWAQFQNPGPFPPGTPAYFRMLSNKTLEAERLKDSPCGGARQLAPHSQEAREPWWGCAASHGGPAPPSVKWEQFSVTLFHWQRGLSPRASLGQRAAPDPSQRGSAHPQPSVPRLGWERVGHGQRGLCAQPLLRALCPHPPQPLHCASRPLAAPGAPQPLHRAPLACGRRGAQPWLGASSPGRRARHGAAPPGPDSSFPRF